MPSCLMPNMILPLSVALPFYQPNVIFVNIETFGDVLDYTGEKRDEKYFKELCFQLDWIVFHLLS